MISSMPMLVLFLSPPEIPRVTWVPTWGTTSTQVNLYFTGCHFGDSKLHSSPLCPSSQCQSERDNRRRCHGAACKCTLESATLVRPSSLIRWFTRASFSLWGTELGSRSAAEKRRFSLTVRVPMTTSSCKTSLLAFRHQNLQNNSNQNVEHRQIRNTGVSILGKRDDRIPKENGNQGPEPRSRRDTWSLAAAALRQRGLPPRGLRGPFWPPEYLRTLRVRGVLTPQMQQLWLSFIYFRSLGHLRGFPTSSRSKNSIKARSHNAT